MWPIKAYQPKKTRRSYPSEEIVASCAKKKPIRGVILAERQTVLRPCLWRPSNFLLSASAGASKFLRDLDKQKHMDESINKTVKVSLQIFWSVCWGIFDWPEDGEIRESCGIWNWGFEGNRTFGEKQSRLNWICRSFLRGISEQQRKLPFFVGSKDLLFQR